MRLRWTAAKSSRRRFLLGLIDTIADVRCLIQPNRPARLVPSKDDGMAPDWLGLQPACRQADYQSKSGVNNDVGKILVLSAIIGKRAGIWISLWLERVRALGKWWAHNNLHVADHQRRKRNPSQRIAESIFWRCNGNGITGRWKMPLRTTSRICIPARGFRHTDILQDPAN